MVKVTVIDLVKKNTFVDFIYLHTCMHATAKFFVVMTNNLTDKYENIYMFTYVRK